MRSNAINRRITKRPPKTIDFDRPRRWNQKDNRNPTTPHRKVLPEKPQRVAQPLWVS